MKKRLFALLNRSGQREIEEMYNKHPELASTLDHGYANGYVAVPPEHPLHGMDYDKAHETADIEIHGGLTFAQPAKKIAEYWPKDDIECIGFDSVDEIPADYWVFGFDTMHYDDGPHHNREWCIDETNYLKEQLEKIMEQ